MIRKQNHQKTTLYFQIFVRLTVPLFILSIIFVGIILLNQINTINHYYQLESLMVFDTAGQIFNNTSLDEIGNQANSLKEKIISTIPTARTLDLELYDLAEKKALWRSSVPWTIADDQLAEKSFYAQRELNKPYSVTLNKKERRLTAYIPFNSSLGPNGFLLRVVYPLAHINEILVSSRNLLLIIVFLIFAAGAVIGNSLAKAIIKPIRLLNDATYAIIKGHLDQKVEIRTGDEIETLADSFNHMSDALRVMKSSAEDSNPLTQLPGNHGIRETIQKRIREGQKFTLFHVDLDRFKIFNDLYGLAKGDQAIIKTAELMRDVIKKHGTPDDFIGHQGGDDFIMIVKPSKAASIAETVIKRFDQDLVKSLYSKEDFERGYVISLDRRGMAEQGVAQAKEIKFPLITISLAGITNLKRDFADYNNVLAEAVKIKKEVKAVAESCFIIRD